MPIQGQEFAIFPATAVTASGTGSAVDVSSFRELDVFLNVNSISGTTPSLTVTLQTLDANSGLWVNVPSGAFSAQTATGEAMVTLASGFGGTVRVQYTISGTTPNINFSVWAVGKK